MTEQETVAYARERRELAEWFARYDDLAARGDAEATADMALFPLNLVTDDGDDSPGSGWTGRWSREDYLRTMSGVLSEGGGDVHFTSHRTPHFLSASIAVVHTESTMTAGGETTHMRYADILVKQDGRWYFQTMAQSGWAAGLRGGSAGENV